MSSDGGDVDGMSSCESETEVVEGVENKRGASILRAIRLPTLC